MSVSKRIAGLLGMNVKDFNLVRGAIFYASFPIALLWGLTATGLHRTPVRAVGIFFTAQLVVKAAMFLKKKLAWKVRKPTDYGSWAIVTGSTSGLGQSFAHELAKRGMNLLLVSRNPDKLRKECAAITEKCPNVKCDFLAHDFTDFEKEEAFYEALKKTIVSKMEGKVGILINNVGIGNEDPYYLNEVDPVLESNMVRVNCNGTVKMTRTVLPFMLEAKKGGIVNVSSGSGLQPTPMLAVYSATKAFINQFSTSVAYEVKEFGVDVLAIHPYYISATGLYAAKKPSLNAPAPSRIVKDTLPCLGNVVIAYPYRFHAFMGFGFKNLVPDAGARVLKIMKLSKARAEARAAKEKSKTS